MRLLIGCSPCCIKINIAAHRACRVGHICTSTTVEVVSHSTKNVALTRKDSTHEPGYNAAVYLRLVITITEYVLICRLAARMLPSSTIHMWVSEVHTYGKLPVLIGQKAHVIAVLSTSAMESVVGEGTHRG